MKNANIYINKYFDDLNACVSRHSTNSEVEKYNHLLKYVINLQEAVNAYGDTHFGDHNQCNKTVSKIVEVIFQSRISIKLLILPVQNL